MKHHLDAGYDAAWGDRHHDVNVAGVAVRGGDHVGGAQVGFPFAAPVEGHGFEFPIQPGVRKLDGVAVGGVVEPFR